MRLDQRLGVTVAYVAAEEALSTSWTDCAPAVSVVRVSEPDIAAHSELRKAGFVYKPRTVTWIAATRESDEAFLGQLSANQRKNIRAARKRATAQGVRIEVRQPLTADLMLAFIELYERNIAQMRHGIAIASRQREVLHDPAYFAVLAMAGPELAGCCLGLECPEQSVVRLRFSAVQPQFREDSLGRVLYLKAVDVARQRGYRWITLGNDPNLYGYLGEPGLVNFKARLGFRPVPSHVLTPDERHDEADLILCVGELTDPAIVLGYVDGFPRDGLWPVLRGEVFTAQRDLDLRRYDTRLIGGFRSHHVPARTDHRFVSSASSDSEEILGPL